MNLELQKLLMYQQEQEIYHQPVDAEMSFYRDVASGNLNILKGHVEEDPLEGQGVLSRDALRNRRYHLVILIAMITRYCIAAGLEPEQAYTMSDMYIRRLDLCNTMEGLAGVKKEAVTDFTRTMHQMSREAGTTYYVRRGIEYIHKRLTTNLKARDVAAQLDISTDYLSKQFRRETGYSLQQYILKEKCRTACYMLTNSREEITEISAFLGFSSSSYFIRQFVKFYAVTPLQYRRTYRPMEHGSGLLDQTERAQQEDPERQRDGGEQGGGHHDAGGQDTVSVHIAGHDVGGRGTR